jgi:hypothetical protein
MNCRTIATSGVVLYAKALRQHFDILRGESARLDRRVAATEASVAAVAGAVNTKGLGLAEICELSKQKSEAKQKMRHRMDIEDDEVALGDLDQDAAANLAAMDKVKANGGAIFDADMAAGDAGGIKFTGDFTFSLLESRAVTTRRAIRINRLHQRPRPANCRCARRESRKKKMQTRNFGLW